jgi:hypothetical protein
MVLLRQTRWWLYLGPLADARDNERWLARLSLFNNRSTNVMT